MRILHRIINLLIIILTIINFAEPFRENYIGEYYYSGNIQSYDELFYKQNCFYDGFYWLGNFSKSEIKYDNLGNDDYNEFNTEDNTDFINILQEGKYESLSEPKSYLITLFSGNHNFLTSFTGTVGAFYKDTKYFSIETLNYALNVDVAVRSGTFVKLFGNVYLIAVVGVDNKRSIRYDYELPGEVIEVGVFKLDENSSEKLTDSMNRFKKDEPFLFGSPFTFNWFIRMLVLVICCFLTKPRKGKEDNTEDGTMCSVKE